MTHTLFLLATLVFISNECPCAGSGFTRARGGAEEQRLYGKDAYSEGLAQSVSAAPRLRVPVIGERWNMTKALLFATLIFISNERSGTVTVIDGATDRVVDTIAVGSRPRGIQVSPDGRTLYVALSDMEANAKGAGDAILAIDVRTRKIVGRFDAGTDPEQFAVSHDGRRLFSANEDAGTASITDILRRRVVATLAVGIEPEGVAISPDNRWVYVTAETSNTVTVIDTARNAVLTSFMVDPRPRAAVFSPDGGLAYVTAEIGGTVSIVDAAKHRVVRTVALPGGAKPVGIVAAPGGERVYVANGHGHSVAVLDRRGQLLQTIAVGKRPWNLALTADGKRLYTANGGSNDVSVVDASTGKVIRTIPAGAGPWGVAVSDSTSVPSARRTRQTR